MKSIITESWLMASALLGLIGFASGSAALVIIGALLFGTGALARIWRRVCLERVVYSRRLAEHRLFVGERTDLTLVIENRKPLPVPWIEVRETMPRGISVTGVRTQAGGAPGTQMLQRTAALGMHDRLEWPMELRAVRRGYFRVGPTRLRSGDLFGFFDREEETGRPVDGIVVYPHVYPLGDLGFDSARPFGDRRGGARIYEDPSRVVGVRDYQPGDPMKRIDWHATVRLGRMQSRLYEPSRAQAMVIALNIPTFDYSWQGSDPVLLERGVSVAASVASWAVESGSAVGLIANGSFPDADRTIHIGAGRRPDQLNRVLEALAMVTAFTTGEMSDVLEDSAHPIPAGATIVLVAAVLPAELVETLRRLRGRGHRVHVVKTSARVWDVDPAPIRVTEVAGVVEALEAEAIAAGVMEAPEWVAP